MYGFINRDEESSVYRKVCEKLLKRNGVWKKLKKDSLHFNVMFGDRNKLPYNQLGQVPGLTQLVNYYRGSESLCRKVGLVRCLRYFWEKNGIEPRSWLPTTYVICPALQNQSRNNKKTMFVNPIRTDERHLFLTHFKQMKMNNQGILWIAKSTAGAKGKDIMISSDPDQLLSFIDQQSQLYVIQKYIENPLLLTGHRKFDIRCWVLLDHQYSCYLYQEGVLRTASDPYDVTNVSCTTSHLTNHSLQEQFSLNFGKYEAGNELFFAEFDRFLSDQGVSLHEHVLPQVQEIVKECVLSVKEQLVTDGLSYHSFQLFGFDFMLDTFYKVWLIEINGAPACAQRLLNQLSESLIHTAIEPLFPTEHTPSGMSLFEKIF